jgi:hypothetical protein
VAERLQSGIEKCITGVVTNKVAREEKYDARWVMMLYDCLGRVKLLEHCLGDTARKTVPHI